MAANNEHYTGSTYQAALNGETRGVDYKKVALAALDTGGGVLSVLNPEGVDLIIPSGGLVLDVTTAATAACTLDAGIGSGATTKYDNLIDGVDVNTAIGVFDNGVDNGTNGGPKKWPAGEYLTVSMASGAAAGLAGYAYIRYIRE